MTLLTQSSHLFGKVCSKLAKKVAAGQEVEGRVAPHGVKGERVHGTGELGHVMQLMLPVGRHPGKCWWWLRRPLCSCCYCLHLRSCCGRLKIEMAIQVCSQDLTGPRFCRTEMETSRFRHTNRAATVTAITPPKKTAAIRSGGRRRSRGRATLPFCFMSVFKVVR